MTFHIDENMPDWAREAVRAACDAEVLKGTDTGLGLTYSELRIITWMYRAGLFR